MIVRRALLAVPGFVAAVLLPSVVGCHLAIDADRHVGECDPPCGDAGMDGGRVDSGRFDAAGPDGGGRDAWVPTDSGFDAGPSLCGSDLHCADGMFCNGMERCDPDVAGADARGCVAGEAPDCDDGIECTLDECSNEAGACVHSAPDGDMDGAGDALCLDAAGDPVGDDCDDTDRDIHPGATELCNGVDDDCDLTVDEGADTSVCASVPDAVLGCDEGCVISSCSAGRGDCDGLYGTGCEEDVTSSAAHCGVCGWACDDALCHDGTCALLAEELATHSNYACLRRASGAVWCWGHGFGATRGDLEEVLPAPGASALGGQLHNTCAVMTDGTVRCWGRTELSGTTAYFPDAPATTGALSDAVSVGVGLYHACALRSGGTVACWGNGEGQVLGASYGGTDDLTDAVAIADVTDAVQIETGWRNDCVRTSAGAVRCWGTMSPSLGDGVTTSSPTPVNVSLPAAATDLDITRNHGCAVLTTGELWCWGRNDRGQLGDGTTIDRSAPVRAHAITDAVGVTVAEGLTCVERSGIGFECWGNNGGRFGDGGFSSSTTPVAIDTTLAIDVIVPSLTAGFGLTTDGSVLSWGGVDTWLLGRTGTDLLRPGYVVGPGS